VLVGAAGLVLVGIGPDPRHRLRTHAGRDPRAEGLGRGSIPGEAVGRWKRLVTSTWAARAAVALVLVLLVAGRAGFAVPLAVAALAALLPSRRQEAAAASWDARVARDLPRVLDLMSTCLEAGLAPADAIQVVCDVVDGPVREVLLPVAFAIRSGADAEVAWSGLGSGGSSEAVRRVKRAFTRAASTGAPTADTLSGLAEDERERLRWTAEAAARRAGVLAVGPLAVCFLPAFLLLGVVPVVVGVATEVLGQLR